MLHFLSQTGAHTKKKVYMYLIIYDKTLMSDILNESSCGLVACPAFEALRLCELMMCGLNGAMQPPLIANTHIPLHSPSLVPPPSPHRPLCPTPARSNSHLIHNLATSIAQMLLQHLFHFDSWTSLLLL